MAQPCFFPSYQYSYFTKMLGTDRKTFLWGGKIQTHRSVKILGKTAHPCPGSHLSSIVGQEQYV